MTVLKKIEEEYNTLVIESHHLKTNLRETREELAHSLYQNEAASRVIAKLLK